MTYQKSTPGLVQLYLIWPRGVLASACELCYVWKHIITSLVLKIHLPGPIRCACSYIPVECHCTHGWLLSHCKDGGQIPKKENCRIKNYTETILRVVQGNGENKWLLRRTKLVAAGTAEGERSWSPRMNRPKPTDFMTEKEDVQGMGFLDRIWKNSYLNPAKHAEKVRKIKT